MRNVTKIQTNNGESSYAWMKVKSFSRVAFNWLMAKTASIAPIKSKPFFYRLMGIKIGKNVQIMPDFKVDIFFPELITIGDGCVIGQDAFFTCHEFNTKEFRYGSITLKENVLIGARSFVLPGVTIGENSLVSAMTLIYTDVPSNVLAYGSPLMFKELDKKKILKK